MAKSKKNPGRCYMINMLLQTTKKFENEKHDSLGSGNDAVRSLVQNVLSDVPGDMSVWYMEVVLLPRHLK